MSRLKEHLINRLSKRKESQKKMETLADQAINGNINSFHGVFKIEPPSEQMVLEFKDFLTSSTDSPINNKFIESDAQQLSQIIQEVKAITGQAALLHGERIKKAQNIMKKYREGTFTKWLLKAYGNRQTPYNLLQYYEFFQCVPEEHRELLDQAPKQAIYCLASRQGPIEEKIAILQKIQQYSKKDFIEMVRETFPLGQEDKRKGTSLIVKILQEAKNRLNERLGQSTKDDLCKALNIVQSIEHQLLENITNKTTNPLNHV